MPGFWRKCRVTFRWLRFAVWLVVLTVIGAFLWLNRVGVPDFLKSSLVATLHERGVSLEFSRLRLHLVHGFVAENVQAGQTNAAASTVFSAREVQLKLNLPKLLCGHAQVDGLVLRNGNVALALSPTNTLTVTNLQTKLRFADNDTWSLDQLTASFSGARITLSGQIRHAAELQNWKMFVGQKSADHGALLRVLKDVSDELQKIKFDGPPQLSASVDGDAREINSFTLRLNIQAPGVTTPWFATRNFELAATVTAPTNPPPPCDASWGWWTNAQPFQLTWATHAAKLHAENLNATALECTGHWSAPEFAVTRLAAQLAGGELAVTASLNVATRAAAFTCDSRFDPHAVAAVLPEKARARLAEITWASPPQWHAAGALTLPPWGNGVPDWQRDVAPTVHLQGELAFTNAIAATVPLDFVRTHFSYSNQTWRLPDFELAQGETKLNLALAVFETTKNFTAQLGGSLALTTLQPFLPTNRLSRLSFPQPLALEAAVEGNLYDLNSLTAAGHLALTNFIVYGAPVDFVQGQFAYSNQVARLADVDVAQGKRGFGSVGKKMKPRKNFQAHLSGALAAASVSPFLITSNAVKGFGYLRFGVPVALALDVTGNRSEFARLAATGHLALTNAAIREQTVDSLTADLNYTNLTLEFLSPHLIRAGGTQTVVGDKVTLDFAAQKLFIVNATGYVEPMVICRAIGPKTAAVMESYKFPEIPRTHANGCIPLHYEKGELVNDDADINFDIVGTTPFRWRKFATPAITGTIHWLANTLILTNAVTECYGGEARGWAAFDLQTPGEGTDFLFLMHGTNVDFHRMGLALWSPTNQLEGAVSGTVMITSANSADWQTWNGYGDLRLQDGILWDVPVFGLVSPMLNVVSPGLGNNRAKDAAGSFVMTNGVIRTDSLKIHTTTMRLEYDGTVDLQERVNARVTAQPLQTMPVLGPLVSTVLWPVSKVFECRVTGTLGQPKATPIYVPFSKLLTAPFHPIRSVTELFTPTPTNAPAPPTNQ